MYSVVSIHVIIAVAYLVWVQKNPPVVFWHFSQTVWNF